MLLKDLLGIDKTVDTPVYLQIASGIIHNIRNGRLRKGLRLPGSRILAVDLGVHRKTMVAALEELLAQGWIEMIPRKGTFVAQHLPDIKPVRLKTGEHSKSFSAKAQFTIDEKRIVVFPPSEHPDEKKLVINDGFPDVRLAPTQLLARELRSLSQQRAFRKYHDYSSALGALYLRETLATYLTDTRGLALDVNNVMVTRGAQMAIYLAAQVLLKPGDHVIVGEPGYFGATLAFQQAGAVVHRIPVDDAGIRVDDIEVLCKKKNIRLLYVIPHHHHPTTVTLSAERRLRLLQLAATYRFAIIEDDYDYDFHYDSNPVMPMASLDQHGNVIYIGTLSKTLAPSYRVGFMAAPENFIHAASLLRRGMDCQGDSLLEISIAALYNNGTMNRHIKKVVKLYHARRDHFCNLLQEQLPDVVSFQVPQGGMSVWAKFKGVELSKISERAFRRGLVVSNGALYNSPAKNYNAARMGFASLTEKEQDKAIAILNECIRS
jgi:GntR family transcriptional regulator/MocR family aminotransferase